MDSGRELVEAGHYPEAIASLEKAEQLAPASAEVQSMLGWAYLLGRQAKPAALSLERALELGSRDARTALHLGLAWRELGRPDAAEAQFRKALAAQGGASGTSSAAAVAQQQLGYLLLFEGRAGEALDPLERAAALLPGDVQLQLQLARALNGAGRQSDALAAWRKAIAMAPALPWPRYGLAQQLQRAGQKAAAALEMETYERLLLALEKSEGLANRERARLDEGWDLLRSGQARQAEALFSALEPNSEALSGVAFSRSAMGDHRGAVAALEKAVALAPEREELRRALDEERLAAESGHR